jgi:hypothetical protein
VDKLLLLGVGSVAQAVRAALPQFAATGTTRRPPDARFAQIAPLSATDGDAIREAAHGAQVVISFPPDGHSDRAFSSLVTGAARWVYLSSTAVYAPGTRVLDETTLALAQSERGRLRLEAEAVWRSLGASVVRLPALYGPSTGLHRSLSRGSFRMPGTGQNIVSRVHVADAARVVLAALAAERGSLLLAGDDQPAPVCEVVSFVCELFGLPFPASAEGTDIPESLRESRAVNNRATKQRYGVRLRYPTYRDGYRAIHASPGVGPSHADFDAR